MLVTTKDVPACPACKGTGKLVVKCAGQELERKCYACAGTGKKSLKKK